MEALTTNASTSTLLDDVSIGVEGGVAILQGSVDDLDSEDEIVAVAESVPGIDEVVSYLEIRGFESADERTS